MATEEIKDSLKVRSYSGCISAAFMAIRDKAIPTTRKYWKIMLIISVLQTALFTFSSTLTNGMVYVGFPLETSQIAICTILTFILYYCVEGCIFSLVNGQKAVWSIVRLFKTIPVQIVLYLIYILFIVGGTYALMTITGKATNQTTLFQVVGIALIMIIPMLVLIVPTMYVFTKYLVEPDSRLYADFFHDYKLGFKHWGLIFLTMLLSALCICIVEATLLMPVHMLELIKNVEAYSMVSQGDEPALPHYFIALYALFTFIKSFVELYIFAFAVYATYFVYGTIKLKSQPKNETED